VLAFLVSFVCPAVVAGQSTQSTIVGTIRDAGGKVVVEAQVRITSTDEGVVSSYTTDGSGDYRAANLKPGHYRVEVAKDALPTEVLESIVLVARQELRVDVTLQVGRVDQQVLVTDPLAAAIDTENATISSSVDANSVLNLPTTFRGNGGTSPLTLISGVQPDADTSTGGTAAGYSVHGGLPSQSETTIDGISTQNTGGNSSLKDAFTSADSIAELRVDGVGNNAEFGQPGQITTISKSGTNDFHGASFFFDTRAWTTGRLTPDKSRRRRSGVGDGYGGRPCGLCC
jgi:hypothetical protein